MKELDSEADQRAAYYQRLLCRLRSDARRWRDGPEAERIGRLINKAKTRMFVWRARQADEPKGPYSGLTRSELAKSGTCETDWF